MKLTPKKCGALSRKEWIQFASKDPTVAIEHAEFKTRWFAYLDLLGFSSLVQNGKLSIVASVYQRALIALHHYQPRQGTNYAWFSDTFIIYGADDSWISQAHVERAAALFLTHLILAEIPVRGAIAVGEFFADDKNGIYVGDALVEAYNIGESQDWIGIVFCPSAVASGKIPVGSPMYPQWNVVFKNRRTRQRETRTAHVLLPGLFEIREYVLGLEEALVKMQGDAPSRNAKLKYRRTLDFLRGHAWYPR